MNNKADVKDIVIQFDHKFLRNSSILFDSKHIMKPSQHGFFQLNPNDDIYKILVAIHDNCNMRDKNIEIGDATFNEKLCFDLDINSLCLQLISTMMKKDMLYIDENGASYSEMINFNSLFNELLANMDNPIDMHTASRMVGLSYSHFSRTFEKITGFNYSYFCNLLRIRHAEELLLSTYQPITEISSAIGINTISYFTRLFKKINGISPSAYRKKYQLK